GATWSPTSNCGTALPTASTTPEPSCPSTTGRGTGYTWSRTTRSVWHRPAATMRTRISSCRGSASTAGATSKDPASRTIAAVICSDIVDLVLSWLSPHDGPG